MLTASNSAGSYAFHYDALGRLTSVDEPYGVSLAFSYDARGNRVLVVDSLGGITSSKYDWANRLVSEVYTRSGSPTVRLDQQYDWAGRVTKQIRYSNAAGTAEIELSSFAYNADGWLAYQNDLLSDGDV